MRAAPRVANAFPPEALITAEFGSTRPVANRPWQAVNQTTKFPRRVRINSQADFRRVFSGTSVSRDRYFKVLYRSNQRDFSRLGMAVSRRNCKQASGRNRIKRQVRESFRLHQSELAAGGGLDLVVLPTHLAATICSRTLRESLERHWLNVSGKAGTNSD